MRAGSPGMSGYLLFNNCYRHLVKFIFEKIICGYCYFSSTVLTNIRNVLLLV